MLAALVLRNYVYRRHLSLSGSSGPPSPAISTTSTDDGLFNLFFEIVSLRNVYLESDSESMITNKPMNRFSFDIGSVLDDDRLRVLKRYREIKKKVKILLRRQADQGSILFPTFVFRLSNN